MAHSPRKCSLERADGADQKSGWEKKARERGDSLTEDVAALTREGRRWDWS